MFCSRKPTVTMISVLLIVGSPALCVDREVNRLCLNGQLLGDIVEIPSDKAAALAKREADETESLKSDHLPAGAIIAVSDSVHGKTYVATKNSIELLQGMHKYEFESQETPSECILPSPDGRTLIVRTIDHSYVFNAGTMRLMHKLTVHTHGGKEVR